jgi:hypothetical protein
VEKEEIDQIIEELNVTIGGEKLNFREFIQLVCP